MFLSKQIHTVDPWTKQQRMANPCINYSQPSVSTIPAPEDPTNCGSGSTAVFTIEKKNAYKRTHTVQICVEGYLYISTDLE